MAWPRELDVLVIAAAVAVLGLCTGCFSGHKEHHTRAETRTITETTSKTGHYEGYHAFANENTIESADSVRLESYADGTKTVTYYKPSRATAISTRADAELSHANAESVVIAREEALDSQSTSSLDINSPVTAMTRETRSITWYLLGLGSAMILMLFLMMWLSRK